MSGRANYIELANTMQAAPGRWVTVNTYRSKNTADTTARAIRTAYSGPGRTPSVWVPAGAYQARVRAGGDGTSRVEARWVGDKSRGGYA